MMRVKDASSIIHSYIQQYKMADFLNEALLSHLELMKFPAYANVYWEEEEQRYFYFLVEGQLQCYHYHLNGKLGVFAVSDPFMAIGDIEILNNEPVKSNVIATRDSTVLALKTDDIERYGADDPRFLRFLIEELRNKLYKTNHLQVTQLLPVTSRLATYLMAQPRDQTGTVILPNKESLASLLGTSFRHLNRVIKTFVDDGIIQVDYPHVRIVNLEGLKARLDT